MLQFPNFDPVALRLGPLAIHWYGLMYLVGFGSAWLLGRWRIAHNQSRLTVRDLEDLIFYGVLGVVAGGRLGYVLFYKPAHYLAHPLEITYLWEGGMSFHGGLLGVLVMMFALARNRGYKFLKLPILSRHLSPLLLLLAGWVTSSMASCGAGPAHCPGRWSFGKAATASHDIHHSSIS